MTQRRWIVARDKPGLLIAMMRVLAGEARISLEGDLSRCRGLYSIPDAHGAETVVLRRNTVVPIQGFVVPPLEPETIQPILQHVLP